MRDLVVRAEVVRYRRECWLTPEGRTIIAPLPAGIKGGYGASLRRFCLMLHSRGQVTRQRLTTLLNDVGVEITGSSLAMIATKRQVIRFLEDRQVDPALLARLMTREPRRFANQVPFLEYLAANGVDIFDKDIVRPFAEAGIRGAIRHHGLVGNAVIVSDDAGQFRVGTHALCWVHAERLLHKLMPATPGQVRHVETLRDLIWRFYKALKAYQRRPDPRAARGIQARFDRIFSIRTGYGDLDKLLFRLSRRKEELLRVLERPETPLHTNASERDLRGFVIKRKISGGTVSRNGRQARDSMLGLMKTCQKLGLSFCAAPVTY
ncbi:hypothetical protein GGQ65_000992 [Rhizobium fabae]|uniref:Transposase IS66 central domain-containing protein n=1 Tax=Rhizobium fabae TaxID=573179 RepID=A0A7W6B4G5_9HYPH|nr:transposase [Rhizobium fabae]MBB3913723.1 hypothetical protein [Rhizobium fabae]